MVGHIKLRPLRQVSPRGNAWLMSACREGDYTRDQWPVEWGSGVHFAKQQFGGPKCRNGSNPERQSEHLISALPGSGHERPGGLDISCRAKQPKKPELHTWAIYQVAAEQKFVGSVHDQPNTEAAIEAYSVPAMSAAD
jgi:hypothetical protein